MEYLLGGCTGLLKEAETTNRSLLRLCLLDDQSLDRGVTSLCWSGGFGGYFEDEITVGYKDGSLISYNYLTMKINREYKLDSRCIYVTMLNYHFDTFVPEFYKKNKDSPLYPDSKRPNVYDTNDRLLLAVTECGYIYVFDWSVDKDDRVSRVKHLTKDSLKDNKNKESEANHTVSDGNEDKNRNLKVKRQKLIRESNYSTAADAGSSNTKSDSDANSKNDYEEYVGALFVYKYRGPIRDAKVHSVMKNRLVLGGTNIAPVLVDLFSETVLWVGKFPHDTVLGLQSPLDITSLCLLEEIDDDLICVATRDSFVYVYDPKCQRDPVFEFNICDYRGIGLSKKSLSLLYEDFNTKHRRRLSRSINEKYSQADRTILRLATRPSYTLEFADTNSPNDSSAVTNVVDSLDIGDVTRVSGNDLKNSTGGNTTGFTTSRHVNYSTFKLNDSLYLRYYNSVKKEFCNLYICDNFGTIYNLQFLTGDRLVWWIYRKIQPIVDLGQLPSADTTSDTTGSTNNNSNTNNNDANNNSNTNNNDANNNGNANNNSNTNKNTNSKTANTVDYSESSETAVKGGVKRPLSADDVYKLNSSDKNKIVQHLIEARKRLCSSSNNDKRVHFRRNHYSQFVCRILNCFNFHNGSVVDLKCIGDYIISAALDRYSNVVNLKTGKLVFTLYCNQKQSCILVKNRYLMTSFNDQAEFKHSKSYESTVSKHPRGSDSEEALDEDGPGESDYPGESEEESVLDSDASEADDSEASEGDDYNYSDSEDADDSDEVDSDDGDKDSDDDV
ncbi:hypothetical protein MACJ_002776 [Theileria orientalis]|uniref:Uncharacterized protein n=1 Tax=Theileria orientalis TaxID=68886 RepID=A0A976M6J1_THEOR|nr:hypothetical protein MACJ_002776 [Theileria orientalis]